MLLAVKYLAFAALVIPAGAAAWPSASFTGCLDEDAGARYVLRDSRELGPLVWLAAGGCFDNQSFAKYLGGRITVRGDVRSESGHKILRVDSPGDITRVSEVCVPQPQNMTAKQQSGDAIGPRKAQASTRSVTGCLDENPGPQYLLRGERELKPILMLDPKGYPVEAFAKHLGKRVEVTGKVFSEEPVPRMEVGRITDLSDSCARDQ